MSDFEKSTDAAWRRWEMEHREDALMYVLFALRALAAERAAERERQSIEQVPADFVERVHMQNLRQAAETPCSTTTEAATTRVAMAREAAPEPASVGHWGMHA